MRNHKREYTYLQKIRYSLLQIRHS